jgi:glycosyltransferase involved in cell wall biosynthesis
MGTIPFKREKRVKRILFVTSNSLATNPRLLKEIRSVVTIGHQATVISFSFDNWSKSIDEELVNGLASKVRIIQLSGGRENKSAWLTSTVASFLSHLLVKLGSKNLLVHSICFFKRSWLLSRTLRNQKDDYDWVIAHNPGAFVPALRFAEKCNSKLGLDIEDFHPGEVANPKAAKMMAYIMREMIEKSSVVTAASPLILEQSLKLTESSKPRHAVINNVFSLQQQPKFLQLRPSPLRLIWFSQTVGLNRGIQDVIHAMNRVDRMPIHLTVIGHCTSEVREKLERLLTNRTHNIFFLPPVGETELIRICSQHQIGLALETGEPFNRDICLTNKLFVYLLAGNAVIASQTTAQQIFMNSYPGIGETYPIGNTSLLAERIEQYISSPQNLEAARRQAYNLANTQLNWEVEGITFISLYKLNEGRVKMQEHSAEFFEQNQNLLK